MIIAFLRMLFVGSKQGLGPQHLEVNPISKGAVGANSNVGERCENASGFAEAGREREYGHR